MHKHIHCTDWCPWIISSYTCCVGWYRKGFVVDSYSELRNLYLLSESLLLYKMYHSTVMCLIICDLSIVHFPKIWSWTGYFIRMDFTLKIVYHPVIHIFNFIIFSLSTVTFKFCHSWSKYISISVFACWSVWFPLLPVYISSFIDHPFSFLDCLVCFILFTSSIVKKRHTTRSLFHPLNMFPLQ